MTNRALKTAFLMLAILFGLSLTSAGAVDLSMTSAYMNTHPTVVNAWEPWFKEVAKKTEGEVQIAYFNPNTLCPSTDHLESTISGMLGIGASDTSRTTATMPLSTVMEIPGLAPSAEAGSLVFWELYQKLPEIQQEYNQVHVLWLWASATYQLHTIKKPVKTLDDLKGMKIITWNRTSADIMQAFGANVIQLLPTDTYLALERGMADGVLCPLAPIVSFKISEACKFTTVCDVFLNGFWAATGLDTWKALSPKAQQVLTETTGELMAKKSGLTLDEGAVSDSEKLKKAGHTFIVLSDEERKKWIEKTEPMREKWVQDMEAKGHKDARKVMETAFELSAKYSPITGRGYKE